MGTFPIIGLRVRRDAWEGDLQIKSANSKLLWQFLCVGGLEAGD